MKKLILFLAIAGFFTQAQAQTLMAKEVPAATKAVFKKAHPKIKHVDWTRNGNNYETKYDTKEGARYVTFDASGTLVESKVQIAVLALPLTVIEFMKKNYAAEDMIAAYQITAVNGTTTYEAEIKDLSLIFNLEGTYIKSVK